MSDFKELIERGKEITKAVEMYGRESDSDEWTISLEQFATDSTEALEYLTKLEAKPDRETLAKALYLSRIKHPDKSTFEMIWDTRDKGSVLDKEFMGFADAVLALLAGGTDG